MPPAHPGRFPGSVRSALPLLLIFLLLAPASASAQPGSVLSHQKVSDLAGNFVGTLDNADLFGSAVTGLGDIDGDGVPDLAVGAPGDDDGGSGRGAAWVLLLDPNGNVRSHRKISAIGGGLTGPLADQDGFGDAVTSLGDFNGDGSLDLAVGAPGDDDGGLLGSNRGAVWLLFLDPNLPGSCHR